MQERDWQITEHQPGYFTIGWETEEFIFYVWFIDGLVGRTLNKIAKVPGQPAAAQSDLVCATRRALQETFEALPEDLFEAARKARRDFEAAEDMVRERQVRARNLKLVRHFAQQHGYDIQKVS